MSDNLTSPENLERIEMLADAATQGPWQTAEHVDLPKSIVRTSNNRLNLLGINEIDGEEYAQFSEKADADYVAAMHPAVTKAIVAEIRRLREEDETARHFIERLQKRVAEMEKEYEEMEHEVAIVYGENYAEVMRRVKAKSALSGAKGGDQPSASSNPPSSPA